MADATSMTAREFVNQILPAGLEMMSKNTKGLNCIVGLHLLGEGGGTWTLTITNGQTRLEEGVTEYLDCVFSIPAEDYLLLVSGRMNPYEAVAKGKVGISGDLGVAARLRFLFRI